MRWRRRYGDDDDDGDDNDDQSVVGFEYDSELLVTLTADAYTLTASQPHTHTHIHTRGLHGIDLAIRLAIHSSHRFCAFADEIRTAYAMKIRSTFFVLWSSVCRCLRRLQRPRHRMVAYEKPRREDEANHKTKKKMREKTPRN